MRRQSSKQLAAELGWWAVVQRNREEDEKRIEKGLQPRFKQESFAANLGKVTSTPEGDKFIEAHRIKRDEKGNALPSTERCKRRRQKRQGG